MQPPKMYPTKGLSRAETWERSAPGFSLRGQWAGKLEKQKETEPVEKVLEMFEHCNSSKVGQINSSIKFCSCFSVFWAGVTN